MTNGKIAAQHLVLPAPKAAPLLNVLRIRYFRSMVNLMLYIRTHGIGTCVGLLHIHIIIIIIIIFIIIIIINEGRKLNRGRRFKTPPKIFNGCRRSTGVEELNPD